MAMPGRSRPLFLAAMGLGVLLLAGCSATGTYPDPWGPRNGEGLLVDPQTGIPLGGQADPGI